MLAGGLLASAGMILASFASRLLELYLTAGVLTGEGTQGFPLQGRGCRSGVPAVKSLVPPKGAALAQYPGRGPILPVPGPARTSCWDQKGHPSHIASPAGLGLALNFQPSLIMLGLYFERRRPLANGLAAAGSPVFLSTLSPLGQLLGERFGWRGGFLLFGGLLLHCCACGAVMRPPPGPPTRPDPAPPGGRARRRRLLDVAVCTDRAFVVYVITKFLMALGLFVPAILLVNYAKDAGVPDAEAAFLLSIVGFVDIVARPACGALAGLGRLRPHVPYLFSLALLANGLTDLISARARSYGTLVAFCIAFGLSYGMVGALQFEVLMATVGAPRFPSALGLVLLVEAVAVLIGPPSAGAHPSRKGGKAWD